MPTKSPIFPQLRTNLAYLYADPPDARRLASDAGLEIQRLPFEGRLITIWDGILLEAEKCGKVAALLTLAQQEYPENPKLLETLEAFQAYQNESGVQATETASNLAAKSSAVTAAAPTDQTLSWLWPLVDAEEMTALEQCFAAFRASPVDRDELVRTTAAVADLEKRYISQNPTQLIESDLQGSVLVCSVGLRPLPVILTTLMARPKRLYLLHTAQSRKGAEAVRDDPHVQKLGLNPDIDIQLREISLTDAPQNYAALQKIVRENANATVVVDISGGVKVMGVSLAAAAFWQRLPVIYQLGEEVAGIIKPFSERLVPVENPFVYFGSAELRSIAELFTQAEYDAALTVCANLCKSTGDVSMLGKLQILERFIQLYRDWDAFAHSPLAEHENRKLATRLTSVIRDMARLGLRFADEAVIVANLDFLQQLEQRWVANQRNNSEPYRLVDIFASAQRRARTGNYDDAVARLYRCLEMSATICLMRDCAIGTVQQPDLSYFVQRLGSQERLAVQFAESARYPLPTARLGLNDQMTLLRLSDDKAHKTIAGLYQGIIKNELLEKRNRSILAHGTVPIHQETYQALADKCHTILTWVLADKAICEELLQQATHPMLELDL